MSETYTKVFESETGTSFYKGKYIVKWVDVKNEQTFITTERVIFIENMPLPL